MVEGGLREICYDCEHCCKEHKTVYILKVSFTPCIEVLIFARQVDNKSRRLVKNAPMQGVPAYRRAGEMLRVASR